MKRIDMYIDHDRSVFFHRYPRDGGVGHVLVLVFAATRKQLALRAAWVGEHAGPPCCFFFERRFVKASYTV